MDHQKENAFDIYPATPEEAEFVDNKVIEFNNNKVPYTQKQTQILKNYVIKHQGKIIAGINAVIYNWNILSINLLFVDESYRGKKLGTNLLRKVEDDAKAMGATLAHLNTFDFQAKDFYIKHGYEIFGVLSNCPPNHKRYYLKKSL